MLKLNVPYLTRKWNKIDLSFVNRNEKSRFYEKEVARLLSCGKKNKEIADFLGLTPGAITSIIKRKGWKRN